MRTSLLLLALAACAAPTSGEPVDVGRPDPSNPAVDDTPIVAVQRLDADGPFVVGATERFGAVIEGAATPRWSASGGELVADGDEVWWTLPDLVGEHTLTALVETDDGVFRHDVVVQTIALSGSAAGVIDDAPGESSGSSCALVIDGGDVPHVLYRSDTHAQWRYARFVGGAWQTELIDGPGFQTGRPAGGQAGSLAVDATGVVHAAFARDDGKLMYARRSTGGAWTVEVAASDSDDNYGGTVALVLDGTTPYLIDTASGDVTASGWPRLRVTRKTTGWTSQVQTAFTGPSADYGYYLRGAVLTGAGAVRTVFTDGYYSYLSSARWTTGGGWQTAGEGINGYAEPGYTPHPGPAPMVAGTGFQGVLTGLGLSWTTNGGSSWSFSPYDVEYVWNRGLAYDGTHPRIALGHDGRLEFLRPDSRGYWTYTTAVTGLDGYDSSPISAAVESNGTLHACFQKDGRVWFQ